MSHLCRLPGGGMHRGSVCRGRERAAAVPRARRQRHGPRPQKQWSPHGMGHDDECGMRIDVPGLGWSSPIVRGDRVFLTTAVDAQGTEQPEGGFSLGKDRGGRGEHLRGLPSVRRDRRDPAARGRVGLRSERRRHRRKRLPRGRPHPGAGAGSPDAHLDHSARVGDGRAGLHPVPRLVESRLDGIRGARGPRMAGAGHRCRPYSR